MYYLIYKITHRDSDMYYIGAHKTNDINDGYMGSGKYIKLAIEYYGIENFDKKILFNFSTEDEMWEKEKELVNFNDEMSYNMMEGGSGGWTAVNEKLTPEHYRTAGKKGSDAFIKKMESDPEFKNRHIETSRRNMKKLWKKQPHLFDNFHCDWTGRTHKQSTIEKMKTTHAKNNHQQGFRNSMYGKMWITNGVISTRIMKNEMIPEGWRKGRIMPV